jgi:hypothetical protein
MADMTVKEAISTVSHVLDLSTEQRRQIADLLEQQQAEIENKDAMLLIAAEGVAKFADFCPSDLDYDCDKWAECDDSNEQKASCWLGWFDYLATIKRAEAQHD